MKNKRIILVAAIALMICSVAVKPAMAYFTATTDVEGGFIVSIGDGIPEIKEKVEDMTKKITIKNVGDYSIFVRAKAIYPDDVNITFEATDGWSDGGDGYYYYRDPIAPGESTPEETPLTLKITREEDATGNFNVIIVQEAVKVMYDKDGNVDWKGAVSSQNVYNLGNQ